MILISAVTIITGITVYGTNCNSSGSAGTSSGSSATTSRTNNAVLLPVPSDGLAPGVQPFGEVSCQDRLFVDAIPSAAWTTVRVSGGSMDSIRDAINNSNRNVPTHILVAPGTYRGNCLAITDHLRSAAAPLWLHADGVVQINCVDGNGQAIGLEHVSYIAVDGFTIGPASGFYGDSGVHVSGSPIAMGNPAHYGEWDASHHIVIRNIVARNLNMGSDGDGNANAYESGCCDGIKANQTEYIWIMNNRIDRTARHGIDLVGVHHAATCQNTLTNMVGAGHGMEAKGGSYDILFERNLINRARHRGIILGGEGTNNVFMWPWDHPAEGSRQVARNNVIVNAAEGGVAFYGCHNCTAINNSIWFTAGYSVVDVHDSVRLYASELEPGIREYWGGSRRAGEILENRNPKIINNLFGSASTDSTCAMNANPNGVSGLIMHHNLWWNGGRELVDCGDRTTSIFHYQTLEGERENFYGRTNPFVTLAGSLTTLPNLRPTASSPLLYAGARDDDMSLVDYDGRAICQRPTIGAFEASSCR